MHHEEPKPGPSDINGENQYWGRCEGLPQEDETLGCEPGVPCVYEDEVDFRIMVLTYMRPESLSEVLQHVGNIEMDGDEMKVEIWYVVQFYVM